MEKVRTLSVIAKVRYFEDGEINGVPDEEGDMTPCKDGENWCPIIDVETGVIINWEQGKTASIHYKVCDSGSYYLYGSDGKLIASRESDYVPKIMCPKGRGYGDYIIMDIDENGKIDNWVENYDGFEFDEEETFPSA